MGPWDVAVVVDDISPNSSIRDSKHAQATRPSLLRTSLWARLDADWRASWLLMIQTPMGHRAWWLELVYVR